MNIPSTITGQHPSRLHQELERARNANEAAALLFPEVAKNSKAFYEREVTVAEFPYLELLDLCEEFWAWTLSYLGSNSPTVFVPHENKFRRYNQSTGIYQPVAESSLIGDIITNLDLCADYFPKRLRPESFLMLKTRSRLRGVVERAKDLLAVSEDWFKDHAPYRLALMNGVLQTDTMTFKPSAANYPVRETLPLKYDPEAKCELFLKSFLANILSDEDIDLLQRYLSQILKGINHSQSLLIVTGDAAGGKSSLMRILGAMVGWNRVGIIREQLFRDEFELAHYAGKHFLFHADTPTDFLNRPEASIFKQLVGGDPLWANVKRGDGRIVLEGNYPIILACNGRPKIHIDEDADAWLRRLVVLSFKTPAHGQSIGKMADLILKHEASGILNWLLEGRAKLARDKLQLTQTPEQRTRTTTLLMASESPNAFVRCSVVKKKDAEMGVVDLYGHYQEWCRKNHVRPFASDTFTQRAKEEIEMGLGLKYRHDLASENGRAKRGWKHLALVEEG